MINKIFNLFKGRRPKDNFDFIAMNIVAIYEALQKNYKGCFSNEEDLITTSGVIDALVYLTEKSISLDELQNAILYAKRGFCQLDLIKVSHEENVRALLLMGPENLILNFILQIEAMLMYVDNQSFNAKEVMHGVISRKKDIKEMIEITKNRIESGELSQVYEAALKLTNLLEFGKFHEVSFNRIGNLMIES